MSYLTDIKISNFRNLTDINVKLDQGITVFHGDNGEGKTSLLEAVYSLAVGKSFKAENERDVLNQDIALLGGHSLVNGNVIRDDKQYNIILMTQSHLKSGARNSSDSYSIKKHIRINKIAKPAIDLLGTLCAVVFHVDDLELVKGSPSGRRKFLDILISQCDKNYLITLRRYNKLLQQRNKLLKLIRDGNAKPQELEYWNNMLLLDSYTISSTRFSVISTMSDMLRKHFINLNGNTNELSIEFNSMVPYNFSPEDFAQFFIQELSYKLAIEIKAGTTLIGSHRDDFKLFVEGFDIGKYGSRGETKIVALSLRMAEASYISSVRGDHPVILLDDVLSELDHRKRKLVLAMASEYGQALITTTDRDVISAEIANGAKYLKVEKGNIS